MGRVFTFILGQNAFDGPEEGPYVFRTRHTQAHTQGNTHTEEDKKTQHPEGNVAKKKRHGDQR